MTDSHVAAGIERGLPPVERVREAYRRIAAADRPEVWITLRPERDVLADAAAVQRRLAAGEQLPLAGLLTAVKDNIDVAGVRTTAACPEYAYLPHTDATAVARLRAAGAVIVGKTNLDQFATGLVGTRSPYGAVRCSWDPDRISGGSSSGSAVAVGLGLADLALGTDTAGSGRVPAAFQGIVGVKATPGVVPSTGVVPACADYDCVSVLAADLRTARRAMAVLSGFDPADPRSRVWPADLPLAAPDRPRVVVPRAADLAALTAGYRRAFARAVAGLRARGADTVEADVSVLLDAATLLYDGALVAERYTAVGGFLDGRPAGADPVVAGIVRAAAEPRAHDFAADLDRVARARRYARHLLDGSAALLLPTTTEHPTLAEVGADPVGVNRRLGTYTNFANLLDMPAVAVPAGCADGGPFGVTVLSQSMHDHVALDVAALITGGAPGPLLTADVCTVLVVGAHLRGEPLNPQLRVLGARFRGEVTTSDAYRLVALASVPAKPGLVRCGPGRGAPIAGELWDLPAAGLGRFLAGLPSPMSLGKVELSDGRWVVGFGCAADAGADGADITEHGGWRRYLLASAGS
ncbi:allophanate hydrolase [Pseudonocardia sp. NPDC046786]|uniref:allophanate hydrolase n=1 Tax=Pseudonocardia sp. NPDC046786 TaxID=3155471 RepID=UPI0033DE7470